MCCLGKAYQAEKDWRNAEQNFILASQIVPSKFYPLYCLAILYQEKGDYEQALIIAEEILQKQEKINSYQIDKIKEEMSYFRDSILNSSSILLYDSLIINTE